MNNKEVIYKSLIPYKSSLQGILTNIMYKFKYENKNINVWMEKNTQYIFTSLFNYFIKEYNINKKDIWEHFRFYLKGGKALHKLLRAICNEDKYSSIMLDTNDIIKSFNKDKCFVNNELFPSTDTDYDFTLLLKDSKLFPNNDETVNNYIIKLLNLVANYMNENDEFIKYNKKLFEVKNKTDGIFHR